GSSANLRRFRDAVLHGAEPWSDPPYRQASYLESRRVRVRAHWRWPLTAAARSPTLIAAAAVLPVLVVFATNHAGFSATTWYPGTLVLLAVLVLGLIVAPRLGRVPPLLAAAVVLLWLYAAWSYLSIAWA